MMARIRPRHPGAGDAAAERTGRIRPSSPTLHWLTVAALAVQFTIGYGIDAVPAWVTGTDDSDSDEAAVLVHGRLGAAILLLVLVRPAWQNGTPLPPWSSRLTAGDRRLEPSGFALLYLSGEERDVAEGREWTRPYDVVSSDAAGPSRAPVSAALGQTW